MILDTLNNLKKYVALNPRFQKVVDFMAATDMETQPLGKVVIDGENLFANFCIAQGKTPEQAKLETHDVMIDIQVPFSCAETMGYTPRTALPEQPYNSEKDITFYPGKAEQYVTVHPGEFAIFFPQDGHAPCISSENEIKKVIFKVKA